MIENNFTGYKKKAGGFCLYIGQTDKKSNRHGFGKGLLNNGSVFVGNYNSDRMNSGKLYEF